MLYLGIDQHKRQLTVNLRSEDGSVILERQVSTEWERCVPFLPILPRRPARRRISGDPEVCGMYPGSGNAQGVRLPGNGGHPTDGADEAEDGSARRWGGAAPFPAVRPGRDIRRCVRRCLFHDLWIPRGRSCHASGSIIGLRLPRIRMRSSRISPPTSISTRRYSRLPFARRSCWVRGLRKRHPMIVLP